MTTARWQEKLRWLALLELTQLQNISTTILLLLILQKNITKHLILPYILFRSSLNCPEYWYFIKINNLRNLKYFFNWIWIKIKYRKTPFLVSGTAIEIYFFTLLLNLILFAILKFFRRIFWPFFWILYRYKLLKTRKSLEIWDFDVTTISFHHLYQVLNSWKNLTLKKQIVSGTKSK